jgi:hypothetical protein
MCANASPFVRTAFAAALATALILVPRRSLAAGGEVTAVASQSADDYQRERLGDGSFKPETYTFGDGGRMQGATSDPSIDRLTFLDVAKVIAPSLDAQKYVPVADRDPDKTKLLIMIYWGTTNGVNNSTQAFAFENVQGLMSGESKPPPPPPPSGGSHSPSNNGAIDVARVTRAAQEDNVTAAMATAGLEEKERTQNDMRNAMLLGYDGELASMNGAQGTTPLKLRRDDLISEIEDDRYFIVVMAYDFDALWKHKKHKLLWVTRFSVRARGTNFTDVLPAMVTQASKYFGQNIQGLLRTPLPEGRVEIGTVKSLGAVPDK